MSVTRKFLTAACAVLLISGAACASKPKPNPTDGGTATGPGGASNGVDVTNMAPTPGSEQDFIVNVGDRVFFDYDQYDVRADARPILDAQARWLRANAPTPLAHDVVVIGIDEAAYEAIPEPAALWHTHLGTLLAGLSAAQPAVVGLAMPVRPARREAAAHSGSAHG